MKFCVYLKRHFKVPDENVLNVGDEVDSYHGGRWPKDPNGKFSAVGELAIAREKIKQWSSYFPKMKLAVSNHGLRWVKKASAAEIPTELLRSYQEILCSPPGWIWKDSWIFSNLKHPFRMIHGMGYSGINGHRNAAIDAGISTVLGHLHSHAGIARIKTANMNLWGMNVGCLIDDDQYAFEYGRDSRFKPCLGAGVVIDSGKVPILIPYAT